MVFVYLDHVWVSGTGGGKTETVCSWGGRLWPPLGTLNPVWGTKMAYKRKILPISWRDFSDLLYRTGTGVTFLRHNFEKKKKIEVLIFFYREKWVLSWLTSPPPKKKIR